LKTAELVGVRDVAEPEPELRMRPDGCLADRLGRGRRVRSRAVSTVLATTRIPQAEMGRAHRRGSGHRTLGRARSEGWDAARTSAASPAGGAKGELGSPGDPVRVSTAVSQRQFEPRPGGRKSSRMAAVLRDRFLPKQGSFPLVDPPGAGRGIPRGVRVSDSAVVAEGPLDQGQSELLGVQK